ncbi:hypothetical protein ACFSTC_18270 [Nonomuraea ferruginea]
MSTPDKRDAADIRRALLERKVRQRVAEKAERERIVPVPRTGKMAIAEQQRFLWFLHQMVAGAPVYNVPFAMRLRGPLDVPALSRRCAASSRGTRACAPGSATSTACPSRRSIRRPRRGTCR